MSTIYQQIAQPLTVRRRHQRPDERRRQLTASVDSWRRRYLAHQRRIRLYEYHGWPQTCAEVQDAYNASYWCLQHLLDAERRRDAIPTLPAPSPTTILAREGYVL